MLQEKASHEGLNLVDPELKVTWVATRRCDRTQNNCVAPWFQAMCATYMHMRERERERERKGERERERDLFQAEGARQHKVCKDCLKDELARLRHATLHYFALRLPTSHVPDMND